MPLAQALTDRLNRMHPGPAGGAKPSTPVLRGDDIFTNGNYPRTWDDFVGQADAVAHLRAHIASVDLRNAVRLDHILLASGLHGIGKTALAKLITATTQTIVGQPGLVEVSGAVGVDRARDLITGMEDGDVLFWDEIHMAVSGQRGKAECEWTLPFLLEGALITDRGREDMPAITVIGATTDAGKLPQTFLSRFPVRPTLAAYTASESEQLVVKLAGRMGVPVHPDEVPQIARAANRNPRDMQTILTTVRDLPDGHGLPTALRWSGFTHDGLTAVALDMLLVLLAAPNHTASIETIQAQLTEPGTLRHHEQTLLQRGLVTIGGRGRTLTDEGRARAIDAVRERT